MAPNPKMDLLMRIRAEGAQALSELKRVQHGIQQVQNVGGQVGRGIGTGFGIVGRTAGALFLPLKLAAGGALALGGALGAIGGLSLREAGNMEALDLRLRGVTSSAEEAKRIFDDTVKMSIFSPYTPQELTEVAIGLLNIGQYGKKAMQAIGDAGAITQKGLVDVVSVLASMETEPLRRMGINLKRDGEQFVFQFRDRMQQIKSLAATGIEDARRQLLAIFDVKYGGGMGAFASAWKGLTSTLMGNLSLAASEFGKGLFGVAKPFVDYLNTQLTTLLGTGKVAEWGERTAQFLREAFDYGRAFLEAAGDYWQAIKADPAKVADAFRIVMTAAARILVTSFIAYLSAAKDIFSGLGRMIFAAFEEKFLTLPLPFMAEARQLSLARIARAAPEGDLVKTLQEMGMGYGPAVLANERRGLRHSLLASSPERQAEFISRMNRRGIMESAMEQTRGAIPTAMAYWQSDVSAAVADARAGLKNLAPDVEGLTSRVTERRERDAGDPFDRVLGVRPVRRFVRTPTGGYATRDWQATAGESPRGALRLGQSVQGHTVISINSLSIYANDQRQLRDELIRNARIPAVAPGGM